MNESHDEDVKVKLEIQDFHFGEDFIANVKTEPSLLNESINSVVKLEPSECYARYKNQIKDDYEDYQHPEASLQIEEPTNSNIDNKCDSAISEKRFKCPDCVFATNSRLYFKVHSCIHRGEELHHCTVCNYKTTMKPHIYKHLKTHSSKNPKKSFKCTICKFATANNYQFNVHLKLHKGVKHFQCANCDYKTTYKSNLRMHIMNHTGDKPFKCDLCYYATANYSHFQVHMCKHNGERPLKCPDCYFSTAYKSVLNNHIKMHTGEKPFKCDICYYMAARKDHLTRHIKKNHSRPKSEVNLVCPDCNYRTDAKESLGHHSITCPSNQERLFYCYDCEYKSKIKATLSRHMKKHIAYAHSDVKGFKNPEQFKCNNCNYVTESKGSLSRHLQLHIMDNLFHY